MDSETFAAYESGCTCWRLVDQYVGWVEQPTEMLGITIFTGAMPDGERLPGLPSRYEAFRLPDSTCKCNGWFRVGLF